MMLCVLTLCQFPFATAMLASYSLTDDNLPGDDNGDVVKKSVTACHAHLHRQCRHTHCCWHTCAAQHLLQLSNRIMVD